MISLIRGKIVQKYATHLTIDVGGVGYMVNAPLSTIANLPCEGSEITMHIHTHVREDQFSLYGFANPEEKCLFQHLLKVQGIGPKTAMAMLSTMTHLQISDSISSADSSMLCSIPGIGRKTAERIIIELKGRLAPTNGESVSNKSPSIRDDLCSALLNLGYQKNEAEKVLSKIDWNSNTGLESALRAALKELS